MVVDQGKVKKKKKNKGWGHEEESKELPASGSQRENEIVIGDVKRERKGSEEKGEKMGIVGAKKLSEMGKTYFVDMGLELGSGFASVAYLGENTQTNQLVCVKAVDYLCLGAEKQALHREIAYLKKFDSSNIVKLYDVYESATFCYLIMEFCKGGDLFKFLSRSAPLPPPLARSLVKQICQGLIELKDTGLIHRDLKTENIFLADNYNAKIGDLGFCVAVGEEVKLHNVGSPIYMSPEVLSGSPHSFQSDIYGLGIIWYELLHKRAPWEAKTQQELLSRKLNQQLIFHREGLIEGDRQMIGQCLKVNPKDRCSVQNLLIYLQSVKEENSPILKQQGPTKVQQQMIKVV